MSFSASSHHRAEYDSASEMAAANHEYLQKRALGERVWWLDLQIFEGMQRIIKSLNEALAGPRNPLLDRGFSSRASVLLGKNGRSVTTFAFPDGSEILLRKMVGERVFFDFGQSFVGACHVVLLKNGRLILENYIGGAALRTVNYL